MLRVLAVDLGASSIRVAAVDLAARPIEPLVLHRYEHGPVRHDDGSLRWDWQRLIDEVIRGLEIGLADGPVASIGIDTWGVDYGLIGADGELLSSPYCYRDERTAGWAEVVERIGARHLYRTTGIQFLQLNTIFQLASHERRELSRARHLLMLPELVVYGLTGTVTGERTSAGTTALVDLQTDDWSSDLLDAIGIQRSIMPPIAPAGTRVGQWRGVPVHLVGGHDTASAVVALPGRPPPGRAFISSGTWMVVGAERPIADPSEAAQRANFSNEPAALGGVRFLKNVMGLWLLDQCRAAWGDPPLDELLAAADAVAAGGPAVDAMDSRFLKPPDMEAEVRAAAGLPPGAGRDAVARCILDSLAVAAAEVVRELSAFQGEEASEICIVGGGSRNWLLNRLIEEASGVSVRAGPSEATALGNALVQGIALGRFRGLDDAREALAPSPAT